MRTTCCRRRRRSSSKSRGDTARPSLLLPLPPLLLLLLRLSLLNLAAASAGSGSGTNSNFPFTVRPGSSPLLFRSRPDGTKQSTLLGPRAQAYLAARAGVAPKEENDEEDKAKNDHEDDDDAATMVSISSTRGGQASINGASAAGGTDANGLATVISVVQTVTNVLIGCGNLVLPPTVATVRAIVHFYQALPIDLVVAQVGLVYCFAGGYYPTLFSSLQAAQEFGWHTACEAISDLTNEALLVLEALDEAKDNDKVNTKVYGYSSLQNTDESQRVFLARAFSQKTSIVLATVDPLKINRAAGALYTTWLGVQSVLRQEYARVITLSLTMAHYMERVAVFVLGPLGYWLIETKYHQWVPVVIGWGCKAAAMNIAWRIQRVMTAATSAMTGGLLFSRALARMWHRRRFRKRNNNNQKRGNKKHRYVNELEQEEDAHQNDDDDEYHRESSIFDEVIGFAMAGLGFYTQFESQWRSGFSFRVPFPLSLITWPFDWAEKWIQWQITKE